MFSSVIQIRKICGFGFAANAKRYCPRERQPITLTTDGQISVLMETTYLKRSAIPCVCILNSLGLAMKCHLYMHTQSKAFQI